MLKRAFIFTLFFSFIFVLMLSCSLETNQWEENADSGIQPDRASGVMLNLLTTQVTWGISDRHLSRRVYYEIRERYPGGAIYGGTHFYPTSYWAEPYPSHYRVNPIYVGVSRYDPVYHQYWYKFYTTIRMDYHPCLSQRWSNISVYYYNGDEPYQNEYVPIWVC